MQPSYAAVNMALDPPPIRTASSAITAVAAAGGAGALVVLGLAAAGAADAGPAVLGAVLVAAITAVVAVGVRRRRAGEEMPAPSGQGEEPPPYELALETLPDPVILLMLPAEDAAAPRYVFANRAARELFRIVRPEGLLAGSVRNPIVLETVAEALVGNVECRALLEPPAGQERVWQVAARPLDGVAGDGGRLGLLWLRDETDARRAERMRADFLANASHELRTPLASLTGFIETLRGHAREDEEARERFLGIMAVQADRMARLVADLLSLSRIELNEHIAPAGSADLNQAVRDVLDAAGPITEGSGPAIEARTAPGRALVQGDRDQVVQVVQNLVDNAVKYAGPQGRVTVETLADVGADQLAVMRRGAGARMTLLSSDHAPDQRFAMVAVTDTGPGIARANLPRLTERFYRVEGQKSGERSGTGLGLAIVKHIVNRHKGALAVESAVGEGTTFTALFPLAAPATDGG
jgi:two-component system phosphate regulon sensor histidine kinase PhoR